MELHDERCGRCDAEECPQPRGAASSRFLEEFRKRRLAARLVALAHQRGDAVERVAALAATDRAEMRGELLALHAKGGAAARTTRDQAQMRRPARSAQPSSRAATRSCSQGW